MSRLMSVSHTEQAVIERRKTVTRRLGWRFLKVGAHLTLCRKVMGLRAGEHPVRLCEVEVVDVRRQPLVAITQDDVRRECVPNGYFDELQQWPDGEWWPDSYEWARWFAEAMNLRPMTQSEFYNFEITRIEWSYL